jgi:branched-subunit amino acid aminotransferase/4-amino-4-deoxychorismate lyase
MPVTTVDSHVIADGRRGPITTRLQQAYRERIEAEKLSGARR